MPPATTDENANGNAVSQSPVANWEEIFHHANWGIVTTAHGIIQRCNETYARMHGRSISEMIGLEVRKLYPPTALQDLEQAVVTARETGHASFETTHLKKDGSQFPIRVDLTILKDAHNRERCHIANIQDISRQRLLEEALTQAKEDWEEVFETINDAITIHDLDFNILRANRAARQLLRQGSTGLVPQKCFQAYHGTSCPPLQCPSCQTARNGAIVETEMFEPHLDRHLAIKSLPRRDKNGNMTGIIHVIRDISRQKQHEAEQERLQKQFFQAQKLEAIGLLAGREIRQLRPELPIILCTGFSESISQQDAAELGVSAFVMKPILRTKMAQTVRQALATGDQQRPPS